MEKLARNKPLFISLSCISIGCLIGSFGYPLQKLEVYKQQELGQFNIAYETTFIITENDLNYPYGFNKEAAILVAQIYKDYKLQKIMLLVLAGLCASYAIALGNETCLNAEIDDEVRRIQAQGRKELILEKVKHRLAMASKSQRLLNVDEMKVLVNEFGSPEGEIMEADELNATDKFINASYVLSEGHSIDAVVQQTWGLQPGTKEHSEMKQNFLKWQSDEPDSNDEEPVKILVDETSFRGMFPESMDKDYWSAALTAFENKYTKEEIVRKVFQCSDLQAGLSYLEYLEDKFKQ